MIVPARGLEDATLFSVLCEWYSVLLHCSENALTAVDILLRERVPGLFSVRGSERRNPSFLFLQSELFLLFLLFHTIYLNSKKFTGTSTLEHR